MVKFSVFASYTPEDAAKLIAVSTSHNSIEELIIELVRHIDDWGFAIGLIEKLKREVSKKIKTNDIVAFKDSKIRLDFDDES